MSRDLAHFYEDGRFIQYPPLRYSLKLLTSEVTSSATQFFKNSCKISHPPQLQASRDALLNFAASHKSGLILVFKEVVLKLKLAKNHFNKNCAPKFLFSNKKNQKDSDDFWHRKLTFILALPDKAAKLSKASRDAYNWGGWLIFSDEPEPSWLEP